MKLHLQPLLHAPTAGGAGRRDGDAGSARGRAWVAVTALASAALAGAGGVVLVGWAEAVREQLFEPGAARSVFATGVELDGAWLAGAGPYLLVAGVHALAGIATAGWRGRGPSSALAVGGVWTATLLAFVAAVLFWWPMGLAAVGTFALTALGPMALVWLIVVTVRASRVGPGRGTRPAPPDAGSSRP